MFCSLPYDNMVSSHQHVLRECRPYLLERLSLSDLQDHLIQDNVIPETVMRTIMADRHPSSQIRALLDWLSGGSPEAYRSFLLALRSTCQGRIQEYLECVEHQLHSDGTTASSTTSSCQPIQESVAVNSLSNHPEAGTPGHSGPVQRPPTPVSIQESSQERPDYVRVDSLEHPNPASQPSLPISEVYNMLHPGVRGRVLVINNYEFQSESLKPRKGWRADSRMLRELFRDYLKFEYSEVQNRTSQEMKDDVKSFVAHQRTWHTCCTVLVVLSHGKNGGVYGSDGLLISVKDDLIHPFDRDNAEHLILKPKLFIIQACRGGEVDSGQVSSTEPKSLDEDNEPEASFDTRQETIGNSQATVSSPSNEAPNSQRPVVPLLADMLVAYSTTEGNVSWRNTEDGSWYVQALHKIFKEHSHTTHVMDMLVMVNRKLAAWSESAVQMPSPECRLVKQWYLFPPRSLHSP